MAAEFNLSNNFNLSDITSKITQKIGGLRRNTHPEINLVPSIKNEMIKTLKLRNLIFFLCIVVTAISVGVTATFGLIAGGQQLAIDAKNGTIDKLSNKINSYSDLNDFLTIKDQLGNISELTNNKTVMSRTFNILSALLPTGADTITISNLTVNLEEGQPTFDFEAQANAGSEPFIDYNVLDSFKKSMQYMNYDYGNYVDKDGNTIPAYCMIETGADGATLLDQSRGIYAFWTINNEGCNPSDSSSSDYSSEDYNGEQVIRIWRTPQYDDWYKEKHMDLNGKISDVAHFESACITYSGDNSQNSSSPKWTTSNQCALVHDNSGETDGISIRESSNGRDTSNELVLRFSAVIYLDPGAFQFKNTHMLAIAPSGYRNVTDSYVQLQAMFNARATDCAEDDLTCKSNTNNSNGGNNG